MMDTVFDVLHELAARVFTGESHDLAGPAHEIIAQAAGEAAPVSAAPDEGGM
jgi:hypothetical protein